MNKKTLIYILFGFAMIGIVTAALVTYLSNTINITMSVTSPFSLYFTGGGDSLSFDTTGGSSVYYETHIKNNANQAISVYRVINVITSPVNWAGDEFDSVWLVDNTHLAGVEVKSLLCHIRTDGSVIKFSDIVGEGVLTARLMIDETGLCTDGSITKYSQASNSTIDNNITITLNPLITPGSYSVQLCHLYELNGSCA